MGPAILDVFVGLYVSEAELIAENLFYSHHQLFMLMVVQIGNTKRET